MIVLSAPLPTIVPLISRQLFQVLIICRLHILHFLLFSSSFLLPIVSIILIKTALLRYKPLFVLLAIFFSTTN